MKEYTREEMRDIERTINNLIMQHNKKEIEKICVSDEYALHYFIYKTMEELTNIQKER